ncbi:arsenate reductase ArsC [Botrimarina sp.]|uniref:arsenate reductase ArsC n=1 Tax=Botrimarina sp. TaxID=2795802 RepID=UPI0032EE1EB0
MKRVLILCTGNSCRSQMAEGLWNDLGKGQWEAVSAGSRPAGYVNPLAIRAMDELGLDISANQSKSVDEFASERFDLAVTVCDNARDACPVFPNAAETLHWPFDDPYYASGDEAAQMGEFRRVRDEIRAKIAAFLAGQRGA